MIRNVRQCRSGPCVSQPREREREVESGSANQRQKVNQLKKCSAMDEQGRAMNQPFPADDQRVNIIDILGSTLNTEGIEDQAKVLTEGDLYSDDCLTVCISYN